MHRSIRLVQTTDGKLGEMGSTVSVKRITNVDGENTVIEIHNSDGTHAITVNRSEFGILMDMIKVIDHIDSLKEPA